MTTEDIDAITPLDIEAIRPLDVDAINPLDVEAITPLSSPDTVDAEQVELSIQAKQIGDRIRRLRTRRSMGLVELGTRTGLSASFLSQLETGPGDSNRSQLGADCPDVQ